MSDKAILFDSSRCSACRGCQVACKCWNGLPSPIEKNASKLHGSYQSPMDLNGDTRLLISFAEEEGGPKGIKWAFGRRSCQHCTDAACAAVCPTGAIHRDEATGMVTVDESKCVGCRRCKTACPYDVPRYHGEKGIINKCTGCVDRIENGMEPACVATCQPNALMFGDRDEMVRIAEERVELLKKKGYEDAMVYGAEEMGGLHVVQVLKYGTELHGQVEDPEMPATAALSQIMKPVVGVASGATVLGLAGMFALAAGYKRHDLVYNEKTEDTLDLQTGEVIKHGDGQDELSVKEHLMGR